MGRAAGRFYSGRARLAAWVQKGWNPSLRCLPQEYFWSFRKPFSGPAMDAMANACRCPDRGEDIDFVGHRVSNFYHPGVDVYLIRPDLTHCFAWMTGS